MSYNWKNGVILALAISLVASLFVGGLAQDQPEVNNEDTLTVATSGTANTLDPSYSYDTASGTIIQNVYENLIKYPHGIVDGNEKNVEGYSVSEFEPLLASVVPTKENNLIREGGDDEVIYEFPLRASVKFHNGDEMTPEDVEYSFERTMIQDRTGGPAWMILEPLTGYGSVEDLVTDYAGVDDWADTTSEQRQEAFEEVIDPAVEVGAHSVVFTLPEPYPPFLDILAHGGGWAAIMDKSWVAEQGGWDGSAETWPEYHDPGGGSAAEESVLYEKMNGTGPFALERWSPGDEVVFTRNDDYWQEPAKVERFVIKKIDEWSTRRLMLQNGDADIVYMPLQYLDQVEGMDGVTVQLELPTIQMNPAAFFTQDVVTEDNDLVGSGEWGDGIPSNFFNDVKVREAFAYSFQYDAFIEQVLQGYGYKTNGPVPKGMETYYNDNIEPYSYDLEKAEELLREAHDGKLWEEGFEFTIAYNTGNESRKTAADIFETNIEKLNPKFEIKVRGIDWSTYLDTMVTETNPLFLIGWLADFADPHNFVTPFMASDGTFSGWQGDGVKDLAVEYFDPLIEAAMETVDVEERQEIYYELQQLARENVIDVWLPQAEGTRVMRSWVQDVPFNPIFANSWSFAYPIWKGYEE